MANIIFFVVVAAIFLLEATTVLCISRTTLKLERKFLKNHNTEMSLLHSRDQARHAIWMHGVVNFPLEGTYDPFFIGLYYTKVRLGSPPKEFHVEIDTGSNILWVDCNSCNRCPATSSIQIPLNFYDPNSSSTSSLVSCLDHICGSGSCTRKTNKCSYDFHYEDRSGTSGYYVKDIIQLDLASNMNSMYSSYVVFGCSTSRTGILTRSKHAVDGIMGLGQHGLSLISQLSSQGMAPNIFSHCLRGDDIGGGLLIFGEVVDPNLVYTSLLPSEQAYYLNLRSISVNGKILSIDPSVFAKSRNRGTVIDLSTTLTLLVAEAFNPFLTANLWHISSSKLPLCRWCIFGCETSGLPYKVI